MSGGLLELDLPGFELHALRGAAASLLRFDVILTEVSFFSQAYEPTISNLIVFLFEHGFELYDIASLSARRRDDRPRLPLTPNPPVSLEIWPNGCHDYQNMCTRFAEDLPSTDRIVGAFIYFSVMFAFPTTLEVT